MFALKAAQPLRPHLSTFEVNSGRHTSSSIKLLVSLLGSIFGVMNQIPSTTFTAATAVLSVGCRNSLVTLVTLVLTLMRTVDASLDASQLRVAQCRAQCLDKFKRIGWTPSDTSCRKEPDCNMCWESCDLLNQNFVVWGAMCSRNDICFPGCQQSCGYYLQGTISDVASSVDSLRLKFLKPIQFTDRSDSLLLLWTRPSGENDINNIVYSVLKRNRIEGESDPKWQPLTQTSELSVEVHPKNLPPTSPIVDFKIIAVTGHGQVGQLVSSYHSMAMSRDEEMSGKTSTSLPQLQLTTISGTPLGSTPVTAPEGIIFLQGQDSQTLPRWKLYLVALQHNPHLGSVDAVVTWAAPGLTGNFLVTWEAIEGTLAITRHMYTDSTTVTLSLWPATTYGVQVQLVSGTLGKAIRSEPLTVNTDSISGPTHHRKQDNDISVVSAPVKECTHTLVVASIAVAASLTVFVIGCCVLIRHCRGKKAQQSPNIIDNKLQRLGAIRKKIILSPLPIDVEGVCPIPTTTAMSSPPTSSSLDERMSTFRGFLNENMVDSLSSPSAKSGSIIFSFPQVNDTTGINRLQFGHLSKDKLLSSSEDYRLVENVFENHLPTENLLSKSRTIRSLSTAI